MKKDDIHRYFLGALEEKVPDKSQLVEMLMETLFMEKGAIYRRLRGEVPFSFFEVVNIAEKLGISLNSLIATNVERIDSFELNIMDVDYKQWDYYITLFGLAKTDPNSEFAESSNLFPASIFSKFEFVYKLYLFKYQYLLSGTESRISFSDYVVPEKLKQIYQSFYNESKTFAKTYYICDHLILKNLTTDLHFFSGINLISEDDIRQIKDDLYALLDYVEEIMADGYFKETGNPVDIYLSDIDLDAGYCYLQINDIYVCLVRTFTINSVIATDKASFERIKNWVQSLRKSSTLITKSGATYRAEFFEKQRKIVSEL